MHKNTTLLISLGVLLLLIVGTWWAGRPSETSIVGYDLLELSDTTKISRIEMISGENSVVLSKANSKWLVNDKYKVDRSIRNFLVGVLKLVRVKREVGPSQLAEVKQWMASGRKVIISGEQGVLAEFTATGNPSKTESYFTLAGDSRVYQVELPGYPNYVSGIFEFTENQWRNRLLFSSDWRSIQSLTVDYADDQKKDVTIAFDKTTLKVVDLPEADTLVLENYIQQYESFFTNEFISKGQIPVYDSLMNATPVATIRLRDIDSAKNTELDVYPGPADQPYVLLKDEAGNYSVCDAGRVRSLLISLDDLRPEK
ncbi:hypothetical protein [uncultured Imperialibacter sp.]|uniref:hypothetical protein n=1 Tax=uncultured Imperialibacter sp. TaxID=1672639 RepID=UPI0030D862B9|tara:strand:- start:19742 stop:20680 length:939 start_codon:yes stop_codon:yes gene_type:complete